MSKRIVLSSRARSTLRTIFENSSANWGEKVAHAYLDKIHESLQYLAEYEVGGQFDEQSKLHSYLIQLKPKAFGHRVYYWFTEDKLVVTDFVHSQSSDRPEPDEPGSEA